MDSAKDTSNDILDQEHWLPIAGFSGYEVSDCGHVRSYKKKVKSHARPGFEWIVSDTPQRMLKNSQHQGYNMVSLKNRNRHTFRKVSVLVLLAFNGPRPTGYYCCHNDGNSLNDHISNLRWGTPQSNHDDSLRHGTRRFGERNGRSKLKQCQVILARHLFSDGISPKHIANMFKVTRSGMYKVLNGETWR